jgi:hypothetical protein
MVYFSSQRPDQPLTQRVVIRLHAGCLKNLGSIPGRRMIYFSSQLPDQPLTQRVSRPFSSEIKLPGREAVIPPSSSSHIKNACSYASSPTCISMAWTTLSYCSWKINFQDHDRSVCTLINIGINVVGSILGTAVLVACIMINLYKWNKIV